MKIETITVGKNLADIEMNCYCLIQDGLCAVIDPGDEADRIRDFITRKNLQPQYIILTHGHIDHIKDAGSLSSFYHIPVYLHTDDKNFIAEPQLNLSFLLPEPFSPFPIARYLKDGDILSLGSLSVSVIHTPGHTPGSICLKAEDSLLTGDTLFFRSVGRTDFPGGDEAALRNSLQYKLFSLEDNYEIYPGHGKKTCLSDEKIHIRF